MRALYRTLIRLPAGPLSYLNDVNGWNRRTGSALLERLDLMEIEISIDVVCHGIQVVGVDEVLFRRRQLAEHGSDCGQLS